MVTPHQLLKKYFGYEEFRPLQLKIIETIISGQDCLALLPTGGGKSVCFQIPGLALPHLTIVVTPLISLMEDQVFQLKKRGVTAEMMTSAQTPDTKSEIEKLLLAKKLKFLYLSPEMLHSQKWQQICSQIEISLIVIDEAHCISQWGHDFRPSYQKIAAWISTLPARPPVAAFTATATTVVQQDIISSLQLRHHQLFQSSDLPDHLHLSVWQCKDRFHKLLRLLQLLQHHQGQPGIIYTSTRKSAEQVTQLITNLDFHQKWGPIAFYHGGMAAEERSTIQNAFITNKIKIIAATNAFGMGVDKPDIRYVIHYEPPSSVEAYTQEVGRAGRDRDLAHCHLLFYQPDLKINQELVKDAPPKQILLKQFIAIIGSRKCLKYQLATYFSLSTNVTCGKCSHCQKVSLAKEKLIANQRLLLAWAKSQSRQWRTPKSLFLTTKTATLVALLRPQTALQAAAIPGLGNGWVKKIWPDLEVIQYN